MILSALLHKVSLPDKACLLSVPSPHAGAWLSVIPSIKRNLHLEPAVFYTALSGWLGIAVTENPVYTFFFPSHHALTCWEGMWCHSITDSGMTYILCITIIINKPLQYFTLYADIDIF